MSVLGIVVTALLFSSVVLVYAACIAGARADEAIRRAVAPPVLPGLRPLLLDQDDVPAEDSGIAAIDPRLWRETAAWLNSRGELRIGPVPVAMVKRFPCHYRHEGLEIYGRSLMEIADVMARIEAQGEVA